MAFRWKFGVQERSLAFRKEVWRSERKLGVQKNGCPSPPYVSRVILENCSCSYTGRSCHGALLAERLHQRRRHQTGAVACLGCMGPCCNYLISSHQIAKLTRNHESQHATWAHKIEISWHKSGGMHHRTLLKRRARPSDRRPKTKSSVRTGLKQVRFIRFLLQLCQQSMQLPNHPLAPPLHEAF